MTIYDEYIGQRVLVMACRFFYHGILIEVKDGFLVLKNPSIVHDTGEPTAKEYAIIKRLPTTPWNVAIIAIESFGVGK